MMSSKKFFLVIVCICIVTGLSATYRGQLHKNVITELPYYPTNLSVVVYEGIRPQGNADNVLNFYIVDGNGENKNNALMACTVINNPRQLNYTQTVYGILSERCVINKGQDCPNPLYDAPIKLVTLANKSPLVVTKNEPGVVYLIDKAVTDTHQPMFSTEALQDSSGAPAEIEQIVFGITGMQDTSLNGYVFAGLTTQELAVVKYDKIVLQETVKDYEGNEKVHDKTDYFFNVLDASCGKDFGNRALAIDEKSYSINGGKADVRIQDLCWNQSLERLYIALSVKTSEDSGQHQGCSSLIVGRLDNNQKLQFDPIIIPTARSENEMFAAYGPSATTAIHKIRTMLTTQGLSYLIVVGGVDTKESLQTVCAFPLTDKSLNNSRYDVMESSLHGSIASKNSAIVNKYVYDSALGNKLFGKMFIDEAVRPEDLPDEKATYVGAGRKLPNDITDIAVVDDVVFVSVAQPGQGQQPGIFYSQALINKQGRIMGWSAWQRFAGVQDSVERIIINAEQFFLSYLKADKAEIVSQITLNIPPDKERVELEKSKGDLSDFANEYFDRSISGVQGLYDFSWQSAVCGNNAQVSLMVATGYKKVAFIETGNNASGMFTGFKEGFLTHVNLYSNGEIPAQNNVATESPYVLIVEGGVLNELGPLVHAVTVDDGMQNWFVVAGPQGVALLADDVGAGISNIAGILPGFNGIDRTMSFKKIGMWKNIKKIVADEDYLYILTKSTLERVKVTQECIKNGSFQSTEIAKYQANEGVFYDVAVSGSLCVLASSKGLLVNAAGTDIQQSSFANLSWNKIELPKALNVPYALFFVTPDGKKSSFAHGAQLYVSTGSLLENVTQIYRLYVHDIYSEGLKDTTVELVEDHIYLDKFGPFISYATFRDCFVTNGVHYLSARSRQTNQRPSMQVYSLPYIKNWKYFNSTPFNVPLNIGKKTKNIFALVQNSATGNWIIAGDFGLRIHN